MRRLLDGLYLGAAWLGGASVVAICALMLAQSVLREFGVPTGGTNDAVAWLCAASAFLPMAHAFKHGDFVRVTLVYEKLSAGGQRALELAALCTATAGIAYLACWTTRFTFDSWRFQEMSEGMLAVPLWIPQTSFVLGAWVFFIAVLDEAVGVMRGARPSYVVAVEERHARGDFSSDL